MLKFSRNWNEEPYWKSNEFWPTFLADSNFDHAYLVEVFKTVCGDCEMRNKILRRFLDQKGGFIFNRYKPTETSKEKCNAIKQCIKIANCKQRRAYITWEYPGIQDRMGYEESHCVVYIYDPTELFVVSVDSRGTSYARDYCDEWKQSYYSVMSMFSHCKVINAVVDDLQKRNGDDHFCQTWSIILTLEIERLLLKEENAETMSGQNMNCDSDNDMSMCESSTTFESSVDCFANRVHSMLAEQLDAHSIMRGFGSILQFWRQLISVEEFKQAIYSELYYQTHLDNGEHRYSRYFTALEAQVNCSNTQYYPHNVEYKYTGYTFLEGFLDALSVEDLHRILA